jgi:hypothetical protein
VLEQRRVARVSPRRTHLLHGVARHQDHDVDVALERRLERHQGLRRGEELLLE